jgi:hypothetical protein
MLIKKISYLLFTLFVLNPKLTFAHLEKDKYYFVCKGNYGESYNDKTPKNYKVIERSYTYTPQNLKHENKYYYTTRIRGEDWAYEDCQKYGELEVSCRNLDRKEYVERAITLDLVGGKIREHRINSDLSSQAAKFIGSFFFKGKCKKVNPFLNSK